ncbi:MULTISPECIES: enoyl-CoA hydratase-related protein [Ramlibacter]|uniref:Enoyl-CoA hydratase/isomerase family protein n=1 Tax=Ramlibacter aquaticus TaxID=2780094 RepID=A0ABR9SGX1_9BURK|nr:MULTISPECIES: enoyl-CoA hydratase-related protein [Ramlibacter]MBE7941608.1 enoyl-CoA hydratase/isomerase family protein [Ramlibacter aquaticus]
MDYQEITAGVQDAVCTITLNRPERLNAWTGRMQAEVEQAVRAAAADEAVRAIVITGAGRGFCAGADMAILEAGAGGKAPESAKTVAAAPAAPAADGLAANYAHRFSYLLRVPKPVFAAINGPVAGIGLCLVLFCDFRYMAEGQKLTTAFARRGLIAEHGAAWMLPRLVGPTHALDLLLSGRTVATAEAAAMGLVRPLPAQDFLPAVQGLAREMVQAASPRSIGVIKRQVWDAFFQDLDASWKQADEEMLRSFASEDFREGVAHYIEKRAPAFTGR